MQVVIDTNIFISALINPASVPAKVLDLIEAQMIQPVMSPATQAELYRVLGYKKIQQMLELTPEEAQALGEHMMLPCQMIQTNISVMATAEDESDNRYIEVALAAKATYVITGDAHLLKLEQYNGIEIVTPAQFLWRMYKLSE